MSILPGPDRTADKPPRARRRVPVALKGFAAVLLLLGAGSVAVIGIPIWRQQSAISQIEAAGGLVRTVPGGPGWLRPLIGDFWMTYFDEVVQVRLDNPRATDATLVWLERLPHLNALSLDKSQVTDNGLARLKSLRALGSLSLAETQVTDAGLAHLKGMNSLRALVLANTAVTDAGLSQLDGLKSLQWLSLAHTPVSDAGIERLKGLTGLQGLTLDGTQVTDAGLVHVKPLTMLLALSLKDTRVTDDGFTDLKRGRPLLSGGPRDYEQRRRAEAGTPRGIFDQMVFGQRGRASVRSRFERILSRRIAAIERICGLAATQKQEIESAGREDINEFLKRIDQQRSTLVPGKQLFRDIAATQRQIGKGPFGDDFLFAKALKATLTPEQVSRLDDRTAAARESKKRIDVNTAGDLEKITDLPINASNIVFSRDGTQVAFFKPVASFNSLGQVDIYDASAERRIRTIDDKKLLVGFDFSPDPDVVAVSDQVSRKAVVVNVSTGEEIELNSPNDQPSVRFSPDGKMLATGGYGTTVHLWSACKGTLLRRFDSAGPEGGLTTDFSPDGTILAVGNRNSVTVLFQASTGNLHAALSGKSSSHELKFDPAGKTLAVAYVDGSLALWDVETGSLKLAVQADADELYAVDWSHDGSVLVTAGRNSLVTLWNANDLSILNELESSDWVIPRFSPDGTRLFIAGGPTNEPADRHVEIWAVR
ncbi:MAG: hypothetical protein ACM3U2_17220 [Deltaproteobacteria bacterium]